MRDDSIAVLSSPATYFDTELYDLAMTLPSQPPRRLAQRRRWRPSALLVPVAAGFLWVLELDPLGGQPTQEVLDLARAAPPRHRPPT